MWVIASKSIQIDENLNKWISTMKKDPYLSHFYDVSYEYFINNPLRTKTLKDLLVKLDANLRNIPSSQMEISKVCNVIENIWVTYIDIKFKVRV